MKHFTRILSAVAFAMALTVIGASAASAQNSNSSTVGDSMTSMAKTVARKTVGGTKAVYKGGKRVGYTVGNKTWTGSKWVASKSWKGGKWVAVKTANGTKWVYRKATGTGKKVL